MKGIKVFLAAFMLAVLLVGSAHAFELTSPDKTTGTLTMTLTIDPYATVTTAPTSIDLTYNGSPQNLITSGDTNEGTMLYAVGNPANLTYSTDIPQETNAGVYLVWYKVSADSGYRDSAAVSLDAMIKMVIPTVTAPTANTLTYNAQAQALITAGSADFGTMVYAAGTASAPTVSYDTTIPTGTNAQTYYVWYKVSGDAKNIYDTEPVSLGITISNAASSVASAPTANTLTFNGSPQALIKAGTANNGTMVYALGSESGSYSASIPTGTNSGTYQVWYKVSGNENYDDTEPASISVTIAKAEPTLTTAPTAITGLTYDGSAQSLINAGSAENGTLNYALGSDASTEPSEYSESIPMGTEAGTYYVWYKIIGSDNYNDTTAQCIQVTIQAPAVEDSYTITYSCLENSTGAESNPTSYTSSSNDITLMNPSKTGYTFTGWTGSNGNVPETSVTIQSGSTGDKSYTANWEIIKYKIDFDLGGGTWDGGISTYDIETEQSISQPTKEGYDFEGWTLKDDEAGTVYKDLTIEPGTTGDREYIAVWSVHMYTITYDLDGGTLSEDNPTQYSIETEDITLNNPAKEGHEFIGWTGTDLTEMSLSVTIQSGSTGDREYKANWLEETPIPIPIPIPIPTLSCTQSNRSIKKGGTIAGMTITSDVTPQAWLTEGELPEGLNYVTDGDTLVISGTISDSNEARDYVFTVRARNESGISEPLTITITVTGSESSEETVQVPAEEVSQMTDEEIQETFSDATTIELTGNVENLAETIAKLEELTDVKELDLSNITVEEVKLENTQLESITLENNESVKTLEITNNDSLTTVNLAGSKVEVVELQGCENLEEVNLDECEELEYVDVSDTPITNLSTRGCKNLGTLICSSCNLENLNVEGCENLKIIDCSNNSLTRLTLNSFDNLSELQCRNQRVTGRFNARRINILDVIFARITNVSASDVNETSELANVKDVKAYDKSGKEISVDYDETTGEVSFSSVPAEIKYNYATGFKDILMDVTLTNTNDEPIDPDDDNKNVLGSHGGCDAGFGIISLILAGLFIRRASEQD